MLRSARWERIRTPTSVTRDPTRITTARAVFKGFLQNVEKVPIFAFWFSCIRRRDARFLRTWRGKFERHEIWIHTTRKKKNIPQIAPVTRNTLTMTEERPALEGKQIVSKNLPKQYNTDPIWNSRSTGFDFTIDPRQSGQRA